MKKNVLLLLTIVLAVSFSACNKIQTDTVDINSSFVVDYDLTALRPLLVINNTPLEWTSLTTKSTQVDYDLVLDWTLSSPLLANGGTVDPLSASAVEEQGDYVYVGFHDYGDEFYGSIIVIEKDRTIVTGAAHSDLIDVNDLEINETLFANTLFIAGESNARGSEALKMATSSGATVLSAAETIGMPIFGASANSITAVDSTVWVSCGGTNGQQMKGGLIILDQHVSPVDPETLFTQDNAKHFDADGSLGLWVHGNNGDETKFYVFDNLPNKTWEVAALGSSGTPVDVTAWGKNAVDVEGDFGYVALGDNGVYKINLVAAPGSVAEHFDLSEIPGAHAGLANGVKTDGDYVYVACGADGLVILDMDLNFIGQWNGDSSVNSDNNGSCNYVDVGVESTSTSKVLYVAFGVGGLRKITLTITP